MQASKDILDVWHLFDDYAMETLTKVWYMKQGTVTKQRSVALIKEHREQFGLSGNCFDLAILLLDAFKQAGIRAYPVGSQLFTERAHVAVVALDSDGRRFLCDLGDQWLQPILLDANTGSSSMAKLPGFFPAADVQLLPRGENTVVLFHRPNGKVSQTVFDGEEIEAKRFMNAAEFSQRHIKPRPLVECRVRFKEEVAHWEFNKWRSFLSTTEGLMDAESAETVEDWAAIIHERTRADKEILVDVLGDYKEIHK